MIEIGHILLKLGVAASFSLAGFLYSRSINNTHFPFVAPRALDSSGESQNDENEMTRLRTIVETLKERETDLEIQLLEFYGIQEQQNAFLELRNRLKINHTEAKFLSLKINSLQEDNKRLQEQLVDYQTALLELQLARESESFLRKKLGEESKQIREHIVAIKRTVSALMEQKQGNQSSDIERWKNEAANLRNANKKLNLENSELASHLEFVRTLLTSVLDDPETAARKEQIAELEKENEELGNTVEELRADRCSDAEELVYLRWINACLRYELRNFWPPQGRIGAKELSKTRSYLSEEKVKQLLMEYARIEGIKDGDIFAMEVDSRRWPSSRKGKTGDLNGSARSLGPAQTRVVKKVRSLVNDYWVDLMEEVSAPVNFEITESSALEKTKVVKYAEVLRKSFP